MPWGENPSLANPFSAGILAFAPLQLPSSHLGQKRPAPVAPTAALCLHPAPLYRRACALGGPIAPLDGGTGRVCQKTERLELGPVDIHQVLQLGPPPPVLLRSNREPRQRVKPGGTKRARAAEAGLSQLDPLQPPRHRHTRAQQRKSNPDRVEGPRCPAWKKGTTSRVSNTRSTRETRSGPYTNSYSSRTRRRNRRRSLAPTSPRGAADSSMPAAVGSGTKGEAEVPPASTAGTPGRGVGPALLRWVRGVWNLRSTQRCEALTRLRAGTRAGGLFSLLPREAERNQEPCPELSSLQRRRGQEVQHLLGGLPADVLLLVVVFFFWLLLLLLRSELPLSVLGDLVRAERPRLSGFQGRVKGSARHPGCKRPLLALT